MMRIQERMGWDAADGCEDDDKGDDVFFIN